MSIHAILDHLDDASGNLALALSKLKRQRAQGIRNSPEEAEFVEELFNAACRKELRPWQVRMVLAFTLAALLLSGSAFATQFWAPDGWLPQALRILGALGIAFALLAYLMYEKRRAELDRDFEKILAVLENP